MIKKYIASVFLGLGITQMHIQPSQVIASEVNSEISCCEPVDLCQIPEGYQYPATLSLCDGWDIYVKGDYLFWNYFQAIDIDARLTTLNGQNTKDFTLKRPYRSGFRVGLGVDLGPVVLDVEYLRYHQSVTSNFAAGSNQAVSLVLVVPTLAFSNLSIQSLPKLDMLVVSIQKPVYLGKRIILNATYGLETQWQQQDWNISCATGTVAPAGPTAFVIGHAGSAITKSHWWAIGPNLGIQTKALLPWGFRIIGNSQMSLLYVNWTKHKTILSFPNNPGIANNTTQNMIGHLSSMQPSLRGELGLGWESYFACDSYHVDLSITYNFLYQVVEPIRGLQKLTPQQYVLGGLAIGGRLDF